MRYTNLRNSLSIGLIGVLLIALLAPISVRAAQITSRKLTLSSSAASATGVTYSFSFVLPSSTVLQSAEAVICTTASGTCTTPPGFSNSSATLTSQPTNLGDASGWTVNTSTSGKLRLKKTGNSAAPTGTTGVVFGNVTNPTANNTSLYARITTYSDDAWTTAVDSGSVASSTASQITVTASVGETLAFCTGTSITGQDCGTISGTAVSLGNLSTSAASTGTSVMAASTNGTSGYAISINGTSLSNGSHTITALGSQAASSPGNDQFGVNLVANSSPSVGANATGDTNATATATYGTTNQFRFVTGDSVASSSQATSSTAFTVSYLANIAGSTPPGSYTATFTYVCTPTF